MMMRDLNIGDVLITENGKLRGIVTDRDLAIHALTDGGQPSLTPVSEYMTANVVTGSPDWTLEHIADVMGKHQIRRLPIVQGDELLGIVSLGDVALHSPKQNKVAQSLRTISESTRSRFRTASPATRSAAILVPIAMAAALLVVVNSRMGRRWARELQASRLPARALDTTRQALEASHLPERAGEVVEGTRQWLQDPKTRRAARQLADQARMQAGGMFSNVSQLTRKPPRKRFLIV